MKNKPIKFRKALLLSVLTVLLLTGCHGARNQSGFSLPESFDTEKKIEISFWAKNDTNKHQVQIYKDAIAEFQKLYPNVTVNMRLYTDYGKIYNDVITNIATGTTPNVCITYPDHIATYATGENVVVPLEELMRDERYGLGGTELAFDAPKQEEIIPKFLDECLFRGHYYALPYMRSTEALYINETLVKKLGYELPNILTWDFVWEVSEAAMKKDKSGNYKVNGQKVLIPFIYKSTDNMMIQMLKQKGADYSSENGEILIQNSETTELLREVSIHAKSGAFSTFKISSYPSNFLNAGQCIFAIDSTAGATWVGPKAPLLDISEDAIVDFEVAVRPIPQFDTNNVQMISQGPSVCMFNKKDPQEVLASWLFLQYLLSNKVQTAYAETEGYVPVTQKAQDSEEYQEYLSKAGEDDMEHYIVKMQASELLRRYVDQTFVTPVFNGSASLRSAAGQLIEDTVKAVRRKKKVNDTFFTQLYKDVFSLYRLDQIHQLHAESESELSEKEREEDKLGPMPIVSKVLLFTLAGIWIIMGICVVASKLKRRTET